MCICSLGDEEEDDQATEIKGFKLPFEVPKNFLNPDKYQPDQTPEEEFAQVPDVVARAVFDALDVNVPIDALNPFVYLRNGRLPEFVVVYFMKLVSRRVKSNMSRFYSAMHLIEMFREYVIVPPTHFMAIDTVAATVVPDVATNPDTKDSNVDQDVAKEDSKEKKDKDDQGASTSNADN